MANAPQSAAQVPPSFTSLLDIPDLFLSHPPAPALQSSKSCSSLQLSPTLLSQPLVENGAGDGPSQASKPWWRILASLRYFPADTGLAIRAVVRSTLLAAEAQGAGSGITCLLRQAISEYDDRDSCEGMRSMAMQILNRFTPGSPDSLPLPGHDAAQTRRPAVPASRTMSAVLPSATSSEKYVVTHIARGAAQFHANVAAIKGKPWFELIQEIRSMKPNNGYPIKVHVAAAMRSAQEHPVHRDPRVPELLMQALDGYARKSCGATKQKALATLRLIKD
eukprot:jgi/Tetstr1/424333/TSEL_014899.t1